MGYCYVTLKNRPKQSNLRRRPRKGKNPYQGPMAEGFDAFHRGVPRNENRYGHDTRSRGKSRAWDQGWIKAKLAKEQGKDSL